MWQEIIITDVTRMTGDRVCVAGVDHQGHCLRPLLPYPQMLCEPHLYLDDTVIIRPRAVLNLFLQAEPEPEPPHVEDHLWAHANRVEPLRIANDKAWRMVLERTVSPSVAAIFETDLHKNKHIAPGTGARSLGTIKPASIDKFGYYHLKFGDSEGDKYRLGFTDASGVSFADLPITDLSMRYYLNYLRQRERQHPARIRAVMEKKLAAAEVWLRLGLTRPYRKADDAPKWCYLQVTGIYTFPDYLAGKCFADFRL